MKTELGVWWRAKGTVQVCIYKQCNTALYDLQRAVQQEAFNHQQLNSPVVVTRWIQQLSRCFVLTWQNELFFFFLQSPFICQQPPLLYTLYDDDQP